MLLLRAWELTWEQYQCRVLRTPQSSSLTGSSLSNCLMPYQNTLQVGVCTPLRRGIRCILQPQPSGPPLQGNHSGRRKTINSTRSTLLKKIDLVFNPSHGGSVC